jgi:arabinogalactan oligomer/maltooligosaccharide transport system substrate-binding protein
MFHKRLANLTAVTAFVLLTSACISRSIDGLPGGETSTPEVQPTAAGVQGTRRITIWHSWESDQLDPVLAAIKEYETAHPEIVVELIRPGELGEDLDEMVESGDGPDILIDTNEVIGTHARDGNIVNLETLGIDRAILDNDFEPAAVKGIIWQNKLWGAPDTIDGIALVYNKALLTEEYMPEGPDDFDRFLQQAQAFAAAYPGKAIVCNPGFGGINAYYAAPLYFGFGNPEFIDDRGNVWVDTPEAVLAGEFLVELSSSAPGEASEGICEEKFSHGEVAAIWTRRTAIGKIADAGIDYGILPFGRPYVEVQAMMITRNAVERGSAEISLDLIRFLTNADNSRARTLANQTIPANTAALNATEIQALEVISGFGTALSLGVPMPRTPAADAQWVPLGEATNFIWTGDQTPEEALSTAQAAIEAGVDEMQ